MYDIIKTRIRIEGNDSVKKYFNIICMLFILSIPFKAKAECDNEINSKINKFASNVTYTIIYKENNNNISFDVVFTNLNNTISLFDTLNNKKYDSFDEITISNLKENTEYKFELYSKGYICSSDSLRTIYVKTPSYNKYYSNKLCSGIENYKYCQKWKNVNISYEAFKQNIETYKETLKRTDDKIETDESIIKKIINIICEVYTNYYYIFLGMIIVISIIYMIKKNNDSKLK